MALIKDGHRILFQGDSITDAGRNREIDDDLGFGYVMMISAWLAVANPARKLTVLNRGIGGDRVRDLKARWQCDALDLQPDIITIFIGINDTWRCYDSNEETPVEAYEADYRFILDRTKAETDAQIVLMDPFVIPFPEDRKRWREDLDPKIQVVRKLAREFKTVHISLDDIFTAAFPHREPAFWAADGVHPSMPGHMLIAQSWLRALEQ